MRLRYWHAIGAALLAATWFAWSASIVAPTTGGTGGSATNAQPPSTVLSNIAASGLSLPYIALSTNSGAYNNVTSIVARSGIVVSNDSAGIASLHVTAGSGSQTPWAQDINGGGYKLTNVSSVTINGTASVPSYFILTGTNDIPVVTQAANSNSVAVTNIVGLLNKASASVIVLDCNHGNKFQITNKLGQATSLIVTNLARGQEISISGDADGTSRVVTIIPQLGYLVRDFDAFGVSAAANKAITATNGNTFEISIAAKWAFGTNFADVVTRQAKY